MNTQFSVDVYQIDQAALGLDQEYLLKGFDNDVVRAYYEYMVNVAKIFGADKVNASSEMEEVTKFEIILASISMSQEKRRNVTGLYHPIIVKDLQTKYPILPWKEYINRMLKIEIDDDEMIILRVPDYLVDLNDVLEKVSKRVLSNYIAWRVVRNSMPFLTQELTSQKLRFDEIFKGVQEKKHRSKECSEMVLYRLDLATGALYARRYFNKDAKNTVVEMMLNIRNTFTDLLQQIDWMDNETRESALEKASSMTSYVAYSDELYDDKKLEDYYAKLYLNPDDYLISILKILAFHRYKSVEKLRLPVNKTDWTTRASPAVVNAYYHPAENSMQFPAGILPCSTYFDNTRPNYMNYGGIGYIIGHEITHGFDDKGRKYDKDGNLNDWWDAQTGRAFNEKAQCIIDQYGNYSVPQLKRNLNGANTQGENIADNCGVKVAYMAYQKWVKENHSEPKLPGLDFTANQLFWISTANSFCSKSRPEYLEFTVLTNQHSPDQFRINVPFGNIKYFVDDFSCPIGSKMNPKRKCQVW